MTKKITNLRQRHTSLNQPRRVLVTQVMPAQIDARRTTQFNPRHLDVANVIVAVTWIEVEHRVFRR